MMDTDTDNLDQPVTSPQADVSHSIHHEENILPLHVSDPPVEGPCCVVCTRPGRVFCSRCAGPQTFREGKAIHYRRWYCSTLCLSCDTPHQLECQPTQVDTIFKQAENAGWLVQELFFTFIEKTWVKDISGFGFDWDESNDNDHKLLKVKVDAGPGWHDGPGGKSWNQRVAGGWFVKFYNSLNDFPWLQPARAAVLSDKNSVWSLIIMHRIVALVFQSLCNNAYQDITVVTHSFQSRNERLTVYLDENKQPIERTDQVYPDDERYGVFKILLKTGDLIALDLAGAQFNPNHRPVMRWDNYWHDFGDTIITEGSSASAWLSHHDMLVNSNMVSYLTISLHIQTKLSDWMHDLCRGTNTNKTAFKVDDTSTLAETNKLAALFKDRTIMPETIIKLTDHMDYMDRKSFIIMQADLFIENQISEIDVGTATTTLPALQFGSLQHPRTKERGKETNTIFYQHGRHMKLPDFFSERAPMKNLFDWDTIKDLAKDPDTPYKVRKEARELLATRVIVSPWHDHRMMAQEGLPAGAPKDTPKDFISVNPHWNRTRR